MKTVGGFFENSAINATRRMIIQSVLWSMSGGEMDHVVGSFGVTVFGHRLEAVAGAQNDVDARATPTGPCVPALHLSLECCTTPTSSSNSNLEISC